MPSLSREQSKLKSSQQRKEQVNPKARLLAEAVTAFAQSSIPIGSKLSTSIGQAVSQIVERDVPRSVRLTALRDVQKAIEASIRAAEEEAPSSLPVSVEEQKENDDFMNQMRDQSLSARLNDIASKKLLTSGEIADRLHLKPAAVTAAVRSHRMFALAGPGGKYYPAFFADEKYDRNVLEEICKALGEVSGGSKWEFFTGPRQSLNGKTPLDAVAKGNVKEVLATAAAFKDE